MPVTSKESASKFESGKNSPKGSRPDAKQPILLVIIAIMLSLSILSIITIPLVAYVVERGVQVILNADPKAQTRKIMNQVVEREKKKLAPEVPGGPEYQKK